MAGPLRATPLRASSAPPMSRPIYGGALTAEAELPWARWALLVILGVTAARLGVLALELAPLHFDEAQYWSYGETLAFGYYSKPPLSAWMIRLSTDVLGDTVFGVRALSPVLHGLIAWAVFATARRLFEGRTGFWAAALYLALPGVSFSAGLMTTDPVMMLGWAWALYATVRAMDAGWDASAASGSLFWWLIAGGAIGFGLLGKYTMIAFVGGLLGYALFSRSRGLRLGGADVAAVGALLLGAVIVVSPNLLWNAQNGFATIAHVGDNARLSDGVQWRFDKAAEFLLVQALIFTPPLLIGLIWMLARPSWRTEWSFRLLMWLTAPLPIAMTIQSVLSRAHPNWAAPAYIAGAIAVAAFLLDRERWAWLWGALGFGAAAAVGLLGVMFVYASAHAELPRLYDPAKKMRPNPPVCEAALAARAELAPRAILLSTDRRLLASCWFEGLLEPSEIAIWNPSGGAGNHYQLTSSLSEATPGPFIFFKRRSRGAPRLLARFNVAQNLGPLEVRTHADRVETYELFLLDGFRGYGG